MKNGFIKTKDIMEIFGCSKSKANSIKKRVQEETLRRGYIVDNNRTCLGWLTYEMYGIKRKGD